MKFSFRRWKIDDLESLLRYADNFNIAKNLTDKFPHPYRREDGLQYLDFAAKNENIFAIDVKGQAVGSIGIFLQDDVHRKNAELGYWLAEPFWEKESSPKPSVKSWITPLKITTSNEFLPNLSARTRLRKKFWKKPDSSLKRNSRKRFTKTANFWTNLFTRSGEIVFYES